MKKTLILDTSPLVASLDKSDRFYQWSIETVGQLAYPFLTCEPVITETCFLLKGIYNGEDAVMGLVTGGNLLLPFNLSHESARVRQLVNNPPLT